MVIDVASYVYTNLYRLIFKQGEQSRAFAVEPAKGLTGAELAARKSHSLKGPFIAKLRLHVWLPGHGWAVAGIFLFASFLLSHKGPTKRSSPSLVFSQTDYHQTGALVVATYDNGQNPLTGVQPQPTEESSDVPR